MLRAAEAELAGAGVTDTPEVANAGYWHTKQMQRIAARVIPTLIPRGAHKRNGIRRRRTGGTYEFMRGVLTSEHGKDLYRAMAGTDRAGVTRSSTARPIGSTAAEDRLCARNGGRSTRLPTSSAPPHPDRRPGIDALSIEQHDARTPLFAETTTKASTSCQRAASHRFKRDPRFQIGPRCLGAFLSSWFGDGPRRSHTPESFQRGLNSPVVLTLHDGPGLPARLHGPARREHIPSVRIGQVDLARRL